MVVSYKRGTLVKDLKASIGGGARGRWRQLADIWPFVAASGALNPSRLRITLTRAVRQNRHFI